MLLRANIGRLVCLNIVQHPTMLENGVIFVFKLTVYGQAIFALKLEVKCSKTENKCVTSINLMESFF